MLELQASLTLEKFSLVCVGVGWGTSGHLCSQPEFLPGELSGGCEASGFRPKAGWQRYQTVCVQAQGAQRAWPSVGREVRLASVVGAALS